MRFGFMTLVTAGALMLAPIVGLLAETFADDRAVAQARADELDGDMRADAERLGFVPLAAASGPRVTALEQSHGVIFLRASRAFSLPLGDGPVSGGVAADARIRDTSERVAAELGRYPATFLAAARLRRVLLCARLTENGAPIPSLPNYEHALLFDADADATSLARLVHHEVFHFADFADDGQLKRDAAWDALNDHFFSYGAGGRRMRNPRVARLGSGPPGFVTEYATAALEEDKAELWAFSAADPSALSRMAEKDALLAKKQRALFAQLERLSPGVVAAFAAAR